MYAVPVPAVFVSSGIITYPNTKRTESGLFVQLPIANADYLSYDTPKTECGVMPTIHKPT